MILHIVYRREHLREVKNCKVIKGEGVTSQHRLVVVDCIVELKRKGKQRGEQKIKWYRLKDTELAVAFRNEVIRNALPLQSVEELYNYISSLILKA